MSGDPTNANIWSNADTYVSFDLEADNPATIDDEFPGAWDLVGLLDGDDGFPEDHEVDEGDHFAWGGVFITTTYAHDKITKKFSALEDNDTTDRLRWPGSTDDSIVIPRPERIKIAFETTNGAVKRRLISANYALVTVDGTVDVNETDVAKLPFIATIVPDTSVAFPYPLWVRQRSTTGS